MLIFFLLPFIQLGVSFWVSVQSLFTALSLIKVRRALASGVGMNLIPKLVVSFLMLLAVTVNASIATPWDYLIAFREIFIVLVLSSAFLGMRRSRIGLDPAQAVKAPAIIVLALTGLIAIQSVALTKGVYIGLPHTLFVENADAFPTRLSLYYSMGRFRPTGTFGEPSYCGFVLLSIVFMFYKDAGSSARTRLMLACVAFDALLLRSMAFDLALVAVLGSAYMRRMRGGNLGASIASGLLAIGGIAAVAYFSGMFDRISNVVSGSGEYSSSARVMVPTIVMGPYLSAHPLGVPYSTLANILGSYTLAFGMEGGEILHNGIFNLLFMHGVIGIPILLLLLSSAPDLTCVVYLICSANFNGAFLSLDKLGVMCLAVAIYSAARRSPSKSGHKPSPRARGVRNRATSLRLHGSGRRLGGQTGPNLG